MMADLPGVRQQRGFAVKRSFIVGVDDTDDSRNALARAAELAGAAGLGLVVVHVRHIPVCAEMSATTFEPARQNLDLIEAVARRAAEEVLQGTGVDWEFVVRSGDPAHVLMVMADDQSAAAIVVGGRPHKAAVSGLAGSVGAALVHRFHGSVLIVRGGDSAWNPASAGFRNALPGPDCPAGSAHRILTGDR
jgi:nucleotide-binding universal stress UspA family protein